MRVVNGIPGFSYLTPSHIVKYSWYVFIVTRKHLSEAMKRYPDAANEIAAWVIIVEGSAGTILTKFAECLRMPITWMAT